MRGARDQPLLFTTFESINILKGSLQVKRRRSFSGTIGSSVSAEMHGFYIYKKKVAARDPGRIHVFSLLTIRRIRENFVQRQIRLTAGSLNFCPCLFDAPRGKSTFLLFREFDVSRTLFY
jgi:hypothetical protein